MSVAALIISIVAAFGAAAAAWYARSQAQAAQTTAAIEQARHHRERAPELVVTPAQAMVRDNNEHAAEVTIRNAAPFALRDISLEAVTDRPEHPAILAVVTAGGTASRARLPVNVLAPGASTNASVWLAWEGDRGASGILRVTVRDDTNAEWTAEHEVPFPSPPRLY